MNPFLESALQRQIDAFARRYLILNRMADNARLAQAGDFNRQMDNR